MKALMGLLEEQNTASIRVAALLEKRTEKSNGFQADYVCFRSECSTLAVLLLLAAAACTPLPV